MQTACIGVYAIRNKINGRAYIGSSIYVRGRFHTHLSNLRRGAGDHRVLQQEWNMHGEAAFDFVLLENVSDENMLIEREQFWMDQEVDPYNRKSAKGNHLSEESKEIIRRKATGRKQSPETCAKRAKSLIGKNKGHTHTDALRAYLSEIAKKRAADGKHPRIGCKHSDAARRKMSDSARKRAPISEETRRRMSETNRNLQHKLPASGFRGVHAHKNGTSFYARTSRNGQSIHIGTFPTAEEAAAAVQKALQ
jgi:group I intron endonuclease